MPAWSDAVRHTRVAAIRARLEEAGVEFIQENGGGPGVRQAGGCDMKAVPLDKDYIAIFAKNVRAGRLAAGMLQPELAKRAGLTQQRVSLIEAGEQNVTLRTIQALGAALGVDPISLLIEQNGAPGVRLREQEPST